MIGIPNQILQCSRLGRKLISKYGNHPFFEVRAGFLQLSTNSQQLFAEQSGHRIMIEQPEAAVAAITQMVEQVRQSIKSSSSASQNHP